MKRRKFFGSALPVLGLPLIQSTWAQNSNQFNPIPLSKSIAESNGRVLVVIQLKGGNDGLNTVIPLDQYDKLKLARPDIVLPQQKILKLRDNLGFHPALEKLHQLYKGGQVAVIQNLGYPNSNKSHFRSTDIWQSASDSNVVKTSGWLGRFLTNRFPGFPEGYPNEKFSQPPSIEMGSVLSLTLQGEDTSLGMAISNPATVLNSLPGLNPNPDNSPAGHELRFIQRVADQTQKYGVSLQAALAKADNKSTLYPEGNSLATQLRSVARLIAGGLNTPVYVASLGGFDTHSNQVESTDVSTGNHAELLTKLSEAIWAFTDDLKKLGIADKVMGFTMSEFGRRIKSNNSLGSDHGKAAPHFVFGAGVKGGILGKNPVIPSAVTVNDDIEMEFDFRSLYASMLQGWLGASKAESDQILFNSFATLPLISDSIAIHLGSNQSYGGLQLDKPFPNPIRGQANLGFYLPNKGYAVLQLYTLRGRLLKTLISENLPAGSHETSISAEGLSSGSYLCQLRMGDTVQKQLIEVW